MYGSSIFNFAASSSASKGGGAKNCQKGKGCGSACIDSKERCVLELGPEVNSALNKVTTIVEKRVSAGAITQEEALGSIERTTQTIGTSKARAQELNSAFDAVMKSGGEEAINATLDTIMPAYATMRDTSAKKVYSEAELKGLESRKKEIEAYNKVYEGVRDGKIKTADEFNTAMRPLAAERRKTEVSDDQVNLAFALLPKTERDYLLNKAGVPATTGIFRPGQSTLDGNAGVGGKPSTLTLEQREARAKLLLKIYLEEGGRDMYTGQRLKLTEAELEHIIPAKVGGQWAESGSNFGWTKIGYNRSKADHEPNYLITNTLPKFKAREGQDVGAFNEMKKRASEASSPKSVKDLFDTVNNAKLKPKDWASITGTFLNTSFGTPKTYEAGVQKGGRGPARIEWMKTGGGIKFLSFLMPKMLAAIESGDQASIDRYSKILKDIPRETREAIVAKFGPNHQGSTGTTPLFADVLKKYTELL